MGENGAIGSYLDYLIMQGRSGHTIRSYTRTLQNLRKWLAEAGLTLYSATADDLAEWRRGLTVAPSSVSAYVGAVRSFYKWAAQTERIDRDPSLLIPRPKLGRRLPRPIAEADLEMAIDTAPDRIRPWLVLAAYAGLRCCEIARLRREDIYDSVPSPYLRVHGKGDKERAVPMSSYVWTELRPGVVALGRARGPAFQRIDGRIGPISANTVSNYGNEHLHACGLVDTMHALRHRFGTATYNATRDLRVVQELLGHVSPATTAGYAAHCQAEAVRAVDAIQPTRRLRAVQDDQE